LGWYSFPEICQRLSTDTRKVECAADLRERLVLLHLKERTWQSLQSLLRDGLEVELKQIDEHRWRLEQCSQAAARSKELLNALCEYLQNEFERTMKTLEPSIKGFDYRYVPELTLIKKRFRDFRGEWWEQNKDRFDSPRDQTVLSELLSAFEMNVDPELEQWATTWFQTLPESTQVSSTLDPNTLRKLAVLTAANAVTTWRGAFLFHALWSDAKLRPSIEEAVTRGYSVRVQPLRRYVADPQIAHWLLYEEPPQSADGTVRIDDIVIVYGFNWNGLEEGSGYTFFGIEPFVYLCEPSRCTALYVSQKATLDSAGDASWVKFLFEQLGDTGKRVWQETEQEYEQFRKSPLANKLCTLTPVPYPRGFSRHFARWIYEWASANGSEIVMEVFPQRETILRDADGADTNSQRKLSLSFLLSSLAEGGVWYARLLDGVVMIHNRLSFLDRLSQMPLASLKRLVTQSDLSPHTLIEAVRSMGNSTRFFSLCEPTWILTLTPNAIVLGGTLYPPNLSRLYQVDLLLGFVPKALRNRLYTTGGNVRLADFPPPACKEIAAAVSKTILRVDERTALLFHPQAYEWVRGQQIECITYERVADGKKWLFTSCEYPFGGARIALPKEQSKR